MKLAEIKITLLEFPAHSRNKYGIIPPGRPWVWQFLLIKLKTNTPCSATRWRIDRTGTVHIPRAIEVDTDWIQFHTEYVLTS